jgi:ferredoxin
MRIEADLELCISAGVCAYTVPEVFGQDPSDGHVTLLASFPPAGLEEAVRQAVELCPSGALTLSESNGAVGEGADEGAT